MSIAETSKKMINVSFFASLVLIAGSFLYYRSFDFIPFALGTLFGFAHNIFKINLLRRAVDKTVDMDNIKVSRYMPLQYFLRYFLTAAVLIISVYIPFISVIGTGAGILTYQIAAHSIKYFKSSPPNETPDS